MALFFNHRKPRPFNYTPRYYDPAKEAREERKKIVLGEKYRAPGGEENNEEYVPGDFIRQQVGARRSNSAQNETFRRRKRKRRSMTMLAAILALLVLLVWLLYFR